MERDARAAIAGGGVISEKVVIERAAELRYRGQAYELSVPLPAGVPDLERMAADFSDEHERTYGYRSEAEPVELVNLKLLARLPSGQPPTPNVADPGGGQSGTRRVFFGPDHGAADTPVGGRGMLAGGPIDGPLIVEEPDATCVVPPGCRASLDATGSIDIEVAANR